MFKAIIFTDQRPLTRDQLNARRMRQMLQNLLANALWHMFNGEPADALLTECAHLSAGAQAFEPLPVN